MATILNPVMIDGTVPIQAEKGIIRSLLTTQLTARSISAVNITTATLNSQILTAVNLTATNINAVNTQTFNLTAYGNVVTDIVVLSSITDIVFDNSYKSKIIHLDTSITPSISASFPNSLLNGFNVCIINAGTGIIYLSAQSTLNAPGVFNTVPYSGMFIYKVNNQFFGIGAFE